MAWAIDLSEVLQRVPQQFFGDGQDDLPPLTHARRLAVLKLLQTRPSADSVARHFGTWRNVLLEAGIVPRPKKSKALRPRDIMDRYGAASEPSNAQLEAFLQSIELPPTLTWDELHPERETELDRRERASQVAESERLAKRAAYDAEGLSSLGAELIEALREAGEDPSELIRRREGE